MTTLHKLNEDTMLMTLSSGKQYLINDRQVQETTGLLTTDLEQVPFDISVSSMIDNATHEAAKILSVEELTVLAEFVQDKIESFE